MLAFSCVSKKDSKENDVDLGKYMLAGSEVSGMAQTVLIKNLTEAIEVGGTRHAVQFCNLNASAILDSVSAANNCIVSRVTDKNRNPENLISNQHDKSMWDYYNGRNSENVQADSLLQLSDEFIFYRPIRIGMPTCLKCHGNPELDIDEATKGAIDSLYPADLAKNYKLGDLRGLWKIEFKSIVQD